MATIDESASVSCIGAADLRNTSQLVSSKQVNPAGQALVKHEEPASAIGLVCGLAAIATGQSAAPAEFQQLDKAAPPTASTEPAQVVEIPNIVHIFQLACEAQSPYTHTWVSMGYQVHCYSKAQQLEECRAAGIELPAEHEHIHASDICRFAVLYNRGGIYADFDVEPNPSYSGPSLQAMMDPTYGAVFGWEAFMQTDEERALFWQMLPKSLCMWLVAAAPMRHIMKEIATAMVGNIRPQHAGESLDHYIHHTTGDLPPSPRLLLQTPTRSCRYSRSR
ncbi:hypothetical protein FOA52_012953 [Chlamydomonas sp. UWO 241]|nr:hypothetical protein FOA52_012953 [Chlamydomonas sp. UWO 241]